MTSDKGLDPNNTDEVVDGGEALGDELTIDDYKQMVSKLRKEAGNRRLKNKEIQDKLQEYDNWKKSQMSEVDRVKAEKAELEAELREYRLENIRGKVAAKVDLDPEFADLIVGDSEEEMTAHAKSLKARLAGRTAGLRPGARGRPVGGEAPQNANEWFLNLMRS